MLAPTAFVPPWAWRQQYWRERSIHFPLTLFDTSTLVDDEYVHECRFRSSERKRFYLNLFFEWRASKGKPNGKYTTGFIQSWNDFVRLYNEDTPRFIERIRHSREKREDTFVQRVRDVHTMCVEAGLDCAVPADIVCGLCSSSVKRLSYDDLLRRVGYWPTDIGRAVAALRPGGARRSSSAAIPSRLVLNDRAPSRFSRLPSASRDHGDDRSQSPRRGYPQRAARAAPMLRTREGSLSSEPDTVDHEDQDYGHRDRGDQGWTRPPIESRPLSRSAGVGSDLARRSAVPPDQALALQVARLQEDNRVLESRLETLERDHRGLISDLLHHGIRRGDAHFARLAQTRQASGSSSSALRRT